MKTSMISKYQQAETEAAIFTSVMTTNPSPSIPPEVLVELVFNDDLRRDELDALMQSHSHVLHLAPPDIYFMKYYRIFIRSLDYGLTTVLQRCLDLGAIPHELVNPCPKDKKYYMTSLFSRSLNKYVKGYLSFQVCFNLAMWLFDQQEYFANYHGTGHICGRCKEEPSLDYRYWLVKKVYEHLSSGCNQRTAHELVTLIQALLKRGARLSSSRKLIVHVDTPIIDGAKDGALVLVHEGRSWEPGKNKNPLTISMLKQAPPALLELTLQQYAHEGIRIRSPLKLLEIRGEEIEPNATPLRDNVSGLDRNRAPVKTELHKHLRYIYYQLFFPQKYLENLDKYLDYLSEREAKEQKHVIWKESHFGQMANELRQNIDILIQYDVITKEEQNGLKSAMNSLQKVINIGRASGFNTTRNGKVCWDILFAPEPFPLEVFYGNTYAQTPCGLYRLDIDDYPNIMKAILVHGEEPATVNGYTYLPIEYRDNRRKVNECFRNTP